MEEKKINFTSTNQELVPSNLCITSDDDKRKLNKVDIQRSSSGTQLANETLFSAYSYFEEHEIDESLINRLVETVSQHGKVVIEVVINQLLDFLENDYRYDINLSSSNEEIGTSHEVKKDTKRKKKNPYLKQLEKDLHEL